MRTAVALLTGVMLTLPASAGAYTITRIADTADGFTFPLRLPAVNATGTVAFHADNARASRDLDVR